MPKLNEIFSGNFLKVEDLQGRVVRVTISKVEVKQFDDGNKIVIHFHGKDKCLVANKTNASIIAENTASTNTDDWIGRTVQLCVKKVEFKGELVPAIRVVLEEQPVQQPSAAPRPKPIEADPSVEEDNIPF